MGGVGGGGRGGTGREGGGGTGRGPGAAGRDAPGPAGRLRQPQARGWAGAFTAELRHRPWAQRWRGWVGGGMGKEEEERRTGAGLGGRACACRHGPGEGA